MPKTKFQEVVFAILMSVCMVFGMELYNTGLRLGAFTNACFLPALSEMRFMVPLCFVTSFFVMDPLAQKIAFRLAAPGREPAILVTVVRAGVTVSLMCPSMSLWATLLFGGIGSEFLTTWMQTVVKNFPMALCYQVFYCGPFVRFLFRRIFCRKGKSAPDPA